MSLKTKVLLTYDPSTSAKSFDDGWLFFDDPTEEEQPLTTLEAFQQIGASFGAFGQHLKKMLGLDEPKTETVNDVKGPWTHSFFYDEATPKAHFTVEDDGTLVRHVDPGAPPDNRNAWYGFDLSRPAPKQDWAYVIVYNGKRYGTNTASISVNEGSFHLAGLTEIPEPPVQYTSLRQLHKMLGIEQEVPKIDRCILHGRELRGGSCLTCQRNSRNRTTSSTKTSRRNSRSQRR